MPIIKRTGRPSYGRGFARSASLSEAPGLWKRVRGLWLPTLGPTGLTLRDHSGFGNHGTLINMDPATDWVIGGNPRLPGYALDFDGVGGHIAVPADVSGETQLTVFALVNQFNVGGSQFGAWVCGNTAFGNSFFLGRDTSDRVQAYVGAFPVKSGDNELLEDEYASYAFTYIGSTVVRRIRLFINGRQVGERNDSLPASIPAHTGIEIGSNQTSGLDSRSRIAMVGIWNSFFTPAEIQQLHDQPAAMFTRRRRVFAAVVAPTGFVPYPHVAGMTGGIAI